MKEPIKDSRTDKVELESFYPHPPQRVWQALTDPAALTRWLMPNDFKPEPGSTFRFSDQIKGRQADIVCTVLNAQPFDKLTYTWQDKGEDGECGRPSLVSWTLTPKDGGTVLKLEHEQMEAPQPYVLIEADMNWRMAMYASLPVLLQAMRNQLKPRVPIVYVAEEAEPEQNKRRAGFRVQEEAPCK